MVLTEDAPRLARLAVMEQPVYGDRLPFHDEPRRSQTRRDPDEYAYFNLFYRAIAERDNVAWATVYAHYSGMVRRWLGGWSGQDDELVAAAFERFWGALDAAKFTQFSSLAAILQYLKMCAVTARMDHARAVRAMAGEEPLDTTADVLPARDDVEELLAARDDASHFWCAVRKSLLDDGEHLVVYLSYVVGMSPREIHARHPERFPDVADVYRVKRNVLNRLRRAPAMQAMLRSA